MAMKLWAEHRSRENSQSTVETLVMKKVPEHKKWVETVFDVVRYLVLNGIPFRGHFEDTNFNSNSFGEGI